ncbi:MULTISPECIES: DsbE family thiol:disulfide interchange protein [unclassified Erythrobacter]|uniref:DsbE family thiol:disulfide interchange protein n=1 Tax=Erythrobacteraceae TaxID=335929 RepID=UPI00076D0C44|nr:MULTISPECIES: DsbE family thiol:disulfide interchange protein [unclassified Erythrobacter]KWV95742.1 alkyl hydroperoxide reductase [Erythrobacter sp. AP23]MBO6768444.1 DsbE family thiol:disulfide interchange protein [Erythrobacter sp.]
MSWRLWVPLFAFALFVGLAAYQLTQPKDEFVQSRMVGEELPYFELPPAMDGVEGVSNASFADGQPRLLNIWASWCLPCIAEAPHLESLKEQGAEIVGVAIRDRPEDVARFLAQHGNPYSRIGRDDLSEVQLAIGSSGVPETFVIDGSGVIRHQHIGDIRADDVPRLLAELEKAR